MDILKKASSVGAKKKYFFVPTELNFWRMSVPVIKCDNWNAIDDYYEDIAIISYK